MALVEAKAATRDLVQETLLQMRELLPVQVHLMMTMMKTAKMKMMTMMKKTHLRKKNSRDRDSSQKARRLICWVNTTPS